MRNRPGTIKEILSQPASLSVVKRQLRSGEKSRTRLAAWVCRRFMLGDARGRLRVASCLQALRDLEREGHWKLPPPVRTISAHWQARRHSGPVSEPKNVPEDLGHVQNLHLGLVRPEDEDGRRTWHELIAREHPQGVSKSPWRPCRTPPGTN